MKKLLSLAISLALLCGANFAYAQTPTPLCIPNLANPSSCVNYASQSILNGLSTTPVQIKKTPGIVTKLYCYNPNASVAYIQIFDALTANITLGTTVPKSSYGIPATNAKSFTLPIGDGFLTAIAAAVTTTATGSTAPGTAMDCDASFN